MKILAVVLAFLALTSSANARKRLRCFPVYKAETADDIPEFIPGINVPEYNPEFVPSIDEEPVDNPTVDEEEAVDPPEFLVDDPEADIEAALLGFNQVINEQITVCQGLLELTTNPEIISDINEYSDFLKEMHNVPFEDENHARRKRQINAPLKTTMQELADLVVSNAIINMDYITRFTSRADVAEDSNDREVYIGLVAVAKTIEGAISFLQNDVELYKEKFSILPSPDTTITREELDFILNL